MTTPAVPGFVGDVPPADKLSDEPARLRAVRLLDIFDTPHESGFDHIADLAKLALDYPIAAVSFIDEDRQWFKAMRGLTVTETPRSLSLCSVAIRDAGPLIVADAAADRRFSHHPFVTGEPRIASYVGTPLVLPDGYAAGTLCVMDHSPREVTDRDLALLQSLADCVVREIELRTEAAIDPMTGLLRRANFLRRLTDAFEVCRHEQRTASLAILDIDHFKAVNDTFGHVVGDAVIAEIGAACREVPNAFPLGRLGGEEFAIALLGSSAEEAIAAMEALRLKIAGLRFPSLPVDEVTVSIGVAALNEAVADTVEWYALADAALYEAKAYGRNRVSLQLATEAIAGVRTLPAMPLPTLTSPQRLADDAVAAYRAGHN